MNIYIIVDSMKEQYGVFTQLSNTKLQSLFQNFQRISVMQITFSDYNVAIRTQRQKGNQKNKKSVYMLNTLLSNLWNKKGKSIMATINFITNDN